MRTVLIVAGTYPPCNIVTSSTKRIEGFVRYLPEYGWRCILLLEACHCAEQGYKQRDEIWLSVDSQTDSEIISHVKAGIDKQKYPIIIRIPCSTKWVYKAWLYLAKLTGFAYKSKELEFEIFHRVFPFPDIRAKSVSKLSIFLIPIRKFLSFLAGFLSPDRQWHDRVDWLKQGSKIGVLSCNAIHIDAIMGSSPVAVNLAVASIISQKTNIPWIADIRDSIKMGWAEDWRSKLDIRKLKRYLRNASSYIHVTSQEVERDRKLIKNKDFVVENGFLNEEIEQAKTLAKNHNNSCFAIRFLGYIHPQRNLDLFLDGFQHFVESNQVTPEDISFEYYGRSWGEMKQSLHRYKIQHFCQINHSVSPTEALFLTASATTLVLPTNNMGQSGIPGSKFYEYIGVERPILVVGGRDEYIEDVIKKTGAGVLCYNKEDVAKALRIWFHQWKQSGKLELQVNRDEIEKLSRRHSAKKLAAILDAIFEGKELTSDEVEKL